MPVRRWRDLRPRTKAAIVVGGAVHLGLAAVAFTDLLRRPAEQVNGRKPLWAAVITVNFVGPIAYLRWGRARPTAS